MSRALADRSYAEIAEIVTAFYRHLARVVVQTIGLAFLTDETVRRRVTVRNPELLERCFETGRDVVAVTGHYGNWEYLNILPALTRYHVMAVYRPLHSSVFGWLMQRVRSRFGMRLVPAGQAGRVLLRPAAVPRLSVFIADQYPGRQAPAQYLFLNQPTAAFDGAERLARVTGAVALYIDMEPAGRGWEVVFSVLSEHPRDAVPGQLTARFLEQLEASICRRPELWLWSHRRWKASPAYQPNCRPTFQPADKTRRFSPTALL